MKRAAIGLTACLLALASNAAFAAERVEVMHGLTQDEIVQVTVCALESTATAYEQGADEAARRAVEAPMQDASLHRFMLRTGADTMAACVAEHRLPLDTARLESCYAIRVFLTSEVTRLRRSGVTDFEELTAQWEGFVVEEERPMLRALVRKVGASEKDEMRLAALRFTECTRFPGAALEVLPEAFAP